MDGLRLLVGQMFRGPLPPPRRRAAGAACRPRHPPAGAARADDAVMGVGWWVVGRVGWGGAAGVERGVHLRRVCGHGRDRDARDSGPRTSPRAHTNARMHTRTHLYTYTLTHLHTRGRRRCQTHTHTHARTHTHTCGAQSDFPDRGSRAVRTGRADTSLSAARAGAGASGANRDWGVGGSGDGGGGGAACAPKRGWG